MDMKPVRNWVQPPEPQLPTVIDDERFISLIGHREDPNYILILDRSENSQKVLALARKNGPIDLQSNLYMVKA